MEEAIDQAKGKQRAMELGSKSLGHSTSTHTKSMLLDPMQRQYGFMDHLTTITHRQYALRSHLTILTHTYCRVNLSTDEGSASSKGYAKENMPFMVLVFKPSENQF